MVLRLYENITQTIVNAFSDWAIAILGSSTFYPGDWSKSGPGGIVNDFRKANFLSGDDRIMNNDLRNKMNKEYLGFRHSE